MPPKFPFVVRDPLYGDIALTDAERVVLDSDIFQRQRGVKQLGTSFLVYPSAVQSRFVHALGNVEIVGEMVEGALNHSDPKVRTAFLQEAQKWLGQSDEDATRARVVQIARLAGMCHDLGHFPLGHVLEYAIRTAAIQKEVLGTGWDEDAGAPHEYATLALIRENAGERPPFRDLALRDAVAEVIEIAHADEDKREGPAPAVALAGLISSEIDSDRAEYLRRDNWVSGAGYGHYDLDKITNAFLLVRDEAGYSFRPSAEAVQAAEAFLIERVRSYRSLYYHPVGVVMDALVSKGLRMCFRREAETGVAPERIKILRAATESVRPSDLHYGRFADPRGYIDDAYLWQYLRRVLSALEELGSTRGDVEEREMRRLHAYLNALLRRRHLWITLWKREEAFAEESSVVLEAFCGHLATLNRGRRPTDGQVQKRMADELQKRKDRHLRPMEEHLSVLNFFAHVYANALPTLGTELEKLLQADPELGKLGTAFFVEVASRDFFHPLKRPRDYRIVSADGERLVPFGSIAPAALQAIEALWFEGIQLWMYVVTERELPEQRDLIVKRAKELLPKAAVRWFATEDLEFPLF